MDKLAIPSGAAVLHWQGPRVSPCASAASIPSGKLTVVVSWAWQTSTVGILRAQGTYPKRVSRYPASVRPSADTAVGGPTAAPSVLISCEAKNWLRSAKPRPLVQSADVSSPVV